MHIIVLSLTKYLFQYFLFQKFHGAVQGSWFSLDEENLEADKTWLQQKNNYNDEQNLKFTIQYPRWSIISNKCVNTEYSFKTGETHVVFRQFGEKKVEIKLDLLEFGDFQRRLHRITDLIKAVEGKINRKPEDILMIKSSGKASFDWKHHQYLLNDSKAALTVKWNMKTKSVLVELARGEVFASSSKSSNQFFKKNQEESLVLSSRAVDYYTRFVDGKIRNAIRMWTNFSSVSYKVWKGCLIKHQVQDVEWPLFPSVFSQAHEDEDKEN